MPCENGCTYSVHAHRDHPDDPAYPIVVCPYCMTRWFGHREGQDAKPLDPKLPPALRDAVLLDQVEHAFEILEQELGYTKTVRPNAILGASSGVPVLGSQSCQVTARPQCDEFLPTHFVTGVGGFRIDDIRVGNRSMYVQTGSIPSEAFRMNVEAPGLILRPGEVLGDAFLDVVAGDVDHLPSACSAFRWPRVLSGTGLIIVATNVSDAPAEFLSWFLGIQRTRAQ